MIPRLTQDNYRNEYLKSLHPEISEEEHLKNSKTRIFYTIPSSNIVLCSYGESVDTVFVESVFCRMDTRYFIPYDSAMLTDFEKFLNTNVFYHLETKNKEYCIVAKKDCFECVKILGFYENPKI